MAPPPHDYHVHSCCSCDSDSSLESICRAAVARGMREIAITDHVDFEPLDACSGFFRPTPYWRALRRCRARFDDRLAIRAGAECGEGHLYGDKLAKILSARPYDFVLGSLHWVGTRPTFHGRFFDDLDLGQGLTLYLEHLARLVEHADYDVLAHLDIIRRAAHRRFGVTQLDWRAHEEPLRAVLAALARRDKGMEVNTSFERLGMGSPGPPVEVLRWFRQEGGRLVTLGSDAHTVEDVGADLKGALAMVREAGFRELAVFEGRRPRLVGIDRDYGVVA